MRVRIAATTCAVIVAVGILHAPMVPVLLGATGAYAWLLWRAIAAR